MKDKREILVGRSELIMLYIRRIWPWLFFRIADKDKIYVIKYKNIEMKGYKIGGIQQIGIGVKNLEEAWKWYIRMFGMDCRIFEDEAEAKLMLPYTGGKPQKKACCSGTEPSERRRI